MLIHTGSSIIQATCIRLIKSLVILMLRVNYR
ncbi:hypothetical protein [Caudoviricetes sp.]|nr:hypothetical protein [Caudoviricetes sp.]